MSLHDCGDAGVVYHACQLLLSTCIYNLFYYYDYYFTDGKRFGRAYIIL